MNASADDLDEVVCTCSGTTRAAIKALYLQGMNAEAISRYSGAISGCGGCDWEIAEFLKVLDKQQDAGT